MSAQRGVFISYRRDDAADAAGRLFTSLGERIGKQRVFMDITGIELGKDFRAEIETALSSADVLLAVIGRNWVGAKAGGAKSRAGDTRGRRLQQAGDFVRVEVSAALARGIPVVPVLVQGATMPSAGDLPSDLEALAFRNAIELRHARWDADVDALVAALARLSPPAATGPDAANLPPAVAASRDPDATVPAHPTRREDLAGWKLDLAHELQGQLKDALGPLADRLVRTELARVRDRGEVAEALAHYVAANDDKDAVRSAVRAALGRLGDGTAAPALDASAQRVRAARDPAAGPRVEAEGPAATPAARGPAPPPAGRGTVALVLGAGAAVLVAVVVAYLVSARESPGASPPAPSPAPAVAVPPAATSEQRIDRAPVEAPPVTAEATPVAKPAVKSTASVAAHSTGKPVSSEAGRGAGAIAGRQPDVPAGTPESAAPGSTAIPVAVASATAATAATSATAETSATSAAPATAPAARPSQPAAAAATPSAVAAVAPPPAEMLVQTVPTVVPPLCNAVDVKLDVTSAPAHGRLSSRTSTVGVDEAGVSDFCLSMRFVKVVRVFYVPEPGFKGTDHVAFDVGSRGRMTHVDRTLDVR